MGYSIKDLEGSSKQKPVVSAPAAKAKGSKPVSKGTPTAPSASPAPADAAHPQDDPSLRVLSEISVDGKRFDLTSFIRAFPRDPLTDNSEVTDAILVLKQMQYALEGGGIAPTKKMPIAATIKNQEQLNEYLAGVDEVVREIQTQCIKVSDSVKAAVNAKQKEKGLEITDPKQKGQGEVYSFEWVTWKAPLSASARVQKAREIINRELPSFIKGNAKSLLALLKETTNVNQIMGDKRYPLSEDKASAIGKLIIDESDKPFAKQIDPNNTGRYYDFNMDLPKLKARLQDAIQDEPLTPSMIKIIKDEE